MRKTLIINSGSSSLKYRLYTMPDYVIDCEGIIERIGLGSSEFTLKFEEEKIYFVKDINNHEEAINELLSQLESNNLIENKDVITKVGHRVVQGGELFTKSSLIDNTNLQQLYDLAKLAPLHNIPNADGIKIFMELLPHAQNVAAFDTEFHQTMPKESYMYATPYEWYTDYDVRRYGAHGTSHKYITNKLSELENKKVEDVNLICCHLGNGASITAVKGGKSIMTSMGLTPLAGIAMGTRCGDIDPSIINYMNEQTGKSIAEITNSLNKESGLLGMSGVSSDFRDINNAIEEGNERAKLARDIFITRVVETVGSYAMRLGRLDYIVFTGGIGENVDVVRKGVLEGVSILGVEVDDVVNIDRTNDTRIITTNDSKVTGYIIPTDEEYQICLEAEQF